MKQSIEHIALVVEDYDDAIEFYTKKLGFTLLEDTPQSETKRWLGTFENQIRTSIFQRRTR